MAFHIVLFNPPHARQSVMVTPMDAENDYGLRLQSILDKVISSGADKILADGDEIVLDIDNEAVIISRIRGKLSVRIVDQDSPAHRGRSESP